MELRDLKALVAVIEFGSFTRAAKKLHLVQSAVSQAVSRLERSTGLQLIERRRAGAIPTEAGAVLALHARQILNSVALATEDVAAFKSLDRGHFRVGILPTAVPLVLAQWIERSTEAFPGIELSIREGMVEKLVELVQVREIDAAILFLPAELPRLRIEATSEIELAVALPPDHRFASTATVSLGDMAEERWISFPHGNPGREWLEVACRRSGFSPEDVIEVETLSHVKAFVEAGVGIALLPRSACVPEASAGMMDLLDIETRPTVTLALATDLQRPESQVQRSLIPILRTAITAAGPSTDT